MRPLNGSGGGVTSAASSEYRRLRRWNRSRAALAEGHAEGEKVGLENGRKEGERIGLEKGLQEALARMVASGIAEGDARNMLGLSNPST